MPKQIARKELASAKRRSRRVKIAVGSGNVFADLQLPDADGLLLKAQIAVGVRSLSSSCSAKAEHPVKKGSNRQ